MGQLAVQMSVSVAHASPDASLDGWIDWNGDGNWGGAAEHVAARVSVVEGDNILQVDVPGWAQSGITAAKFRLSTTGGRIDVFQDYQFTLLPPVYPSGQFGPEIPINSLAAVQFASTADLDRDGDLDLLSATFDGDGTIAWYENDGSQVFTRHVITTAAAEATCVIAVDINGDGHLDVVTSSLGNNTIAWYQNDGHQQFTGRTITTSALKVSSLYVADLDGDGDLDIVSASKGDNLIAWYENNGSQGFARHIITTTVDVPCAVSAADLDGDGDLDVVSASLFDDTIAWYENDGSQNFVKRIITTTADGVRGIFVADLDGDGDQDVVSSCLYANTIVWYENDGQGDFAGRIISSTALNAAAVYVADLDGDGDFDVLGSSRGNMTIAWFENTGGVNFPQHTITTANSEARGIIAADVDGDGDLDVVSASKSGNRLAWYENLVDPAPLKVALESTSPSFTNSPTIPVRVSFNRPITGFTADRLIVQNGSLSNFVGSGSTYSFDLIASNEGTVTIMLPAEAVTDVAGFGNTAAILNREYTIVPPGLTHPGGGATFFRNGLPINVSPELTVSGSRVGGGTLVVVITSIKSGKSQFDVLDDTPLSVLGTLARTSTSEKRVTTVSLNSTTSADDIQAALRLMTFSTSRVGLHFKTRQVRIKLTDDAGQSGPTLIQTIQVRKKGIVA